MNTGLIVVDSQIVATAGADDITNAGSIQRSGFGNALLLGAGADVYRGATGLIVGEIRLGTGDDSAYGGAGSETFSGDAGDDFIDGGAGNDTVLFSGEAATVDLRSTGWQQTGSGLDRLLNIENVTSSGSDDVLVGNDGDNVLRSQGGNDLLEGGAGNDTLDGGAVSGEINIARYAGSAAATVSLLLQGQKQNTGGYGFDTLIAINALEGGSGNDVFIGDGRANRLVGNGGDDVLTGGLGDDTLDGGSGRNTAVFAGSRDKYAVQTNGSASASVTSVDGQDVLTNVRILQFDNQTMVLNTGPDAPSVSNTTIAENTLVSTIVATLSSQDADGDAVSYSLLDDGGGTFRVDGNNLVLVRALDFETARQTTITVKATDTYGGETVRSVSLAIANVVETDAKTIVGGVGNDSLSGEAGNDQIYGLAGQDALVGGAGNDKLYGGVGNDSLWGGAGQDVFVFDQRNARTNTLNKSYNLDRIRDFSVADDTIHLAKSVFSKIAKKGVLASDAFYSGAAAHDGSDRIIYNKKTGAVLYDDDGNGHHAAIQIATLDARLGLTNRDFFVI